MLSFQIYRTLKLNSRRIGIIIVITVQEDGKSPVSTLKGTSRSIYVYDY